MTDRTAGDRLPAAQWRDLGLVRAPAAELIADSAALLDDLARDPRPTLRWYRSTDTALILGRGQRLADFARADLPVVTRFSGGGAVLMDDGLLSLDVIVPAGHPLLDGELAATFLRVGRAWSQALDRLGVPDLAVSSAASPARRQGSPREQLLAAICYATLGRGEVTSGGRKIVGLAQRRRRHGALVQCGLLRTWRPEPLLRAIGATPRDAQIAHAAVGLDDFLDNPPDDEQVMAAVHDALRGMER